MKIDIIKIFQEDTINWVDKLQEDEWFFSKLLEKITKNLSPSQAFELIPDAVSLILKQSDEQLCSEAFQLLLDLVMISNTTEMNPGLLENWDRLIKHVSSFGEYHKNKAHELEKWYRRGT